MTGCRRQCASSVAHRRYYVVTEAANSQGATVSDQSNGEKVYDVVILGAGSGGYAAALRAAELNLSVAMVEKDKVGGTCLHRGCIPTKALLHAAEIADHTRESEQFGVRTSLEGIDMTGVNEYKDGVVGRLYKGLAGLVKSRRIKVVEGDGRLVAADTVEVGGRRLQGRNVVLATGSYARTLPGLEIGGRVMTSDHALSSTTCPNRVVVLGGGVIGVRVRLRLEVLRLRGDDRRGSAPARRHTRTRPAPRRSSGRSAGGRSTSGPACDSRRRSSTDAGVTVSLESRRDHRGRHPAGRRRSRAERDGLRLRGGRRPHGPRLRPHRRADADQRRNVYAVGDIVPGLQLAHRGFQQGIFVAEQIAGLEPAPIVESGIPRVTYCDPEVASVGITEAQARSSTAPTPSRPTSTTSAATARARSSPPRASSSSSGRRTARWSASTWSARGWAS